MELTKKQEEGLKITLERWRNKEKFTVISGFAGSGKSTLIKFIIAAMGLPIECVRYVAYTGKAANVLKNKGCENATTAHKLLYHATRLPNGKYSYRQKSKGEIWQEGIKVVVVDEVSMLPKKMWDLLCQYSFYIIACGDPEQLPPVPDHTGEDPNNHVLDHPHIFLDEIMRQAQESEIIRLSMHVRYGQPLNTFDCQNEQVMFFHKEDINNSVLLWADQVLCATNRRRHELNKAIRIANNFLEDLQIDDKVINLHNEWEILSNKENPLTNGIIGKIKNINVEEWNYPFTLRGRPFSVPVFTADISGDEEDEVFTQLTFDYNEIKTGTPSLTGEEEYKLYKMKKSLPLHANFGYAITTWKSQGSEWDKVLLFPEKGWPRDPESIKKFMYTSITRAAKKLVIVI